MSGDTTTALAVPQILDVTVARTAFPVVEAELEYVSRAARLLKQGFHSHALLDLWNAAVHNLRRRVEAHSSELFESVVASLSGRAKYDKNGDTLAERWGGVEDAVLIRGCRRLGLLSKKAARVLENVGWFRNHASAAHGSDDEVGYVDVVTLAAQLEENLFKLALPEPGHSVADIFKSLPTKPAAAA